MANQTRVEIIISAKNQTEKAIDAVRQRVTGLKTELGAVGSTAERAGVQSGQAFDKAGAAADHAGHKVGFFHSAIGNSIMQLMMLQMVGTMAFQAVAAVVRNTYGEVEKFNLSVTQMAALITSFQPSGDLATNYRNAKDYAQGLVVVLEEIDAKTVASAGDLQLITEEMAKQRVLLDANNAAQVAGFTNLANAVAVIAGGYQNKEIQIRQEIRSLMQGEVDMNSQLSQQVNAMVGGGLKDKVELWKKEGRLIEEIGGLLTGYAAASADIEATWAAIGSTMETIKSRTMRLGFSDMYRDVNQQLMLMNTYLKAHTSEIGGTLRRGWLATKGLVEAIGDLLRAFEYPLGAASYLIGVIVEGLGMTAAVALPVITAKLVTMVALLRDIVHLGYVFGGFFIDAIGIALESMGNIGKILYNIITLNKEGLAAAVNSFNNMDSVERLKDDALLLKGVLISIKENTGDLFNLEDFDRRYAEYIRQAGELKKNPTTPDLGTAPDAEAEKNAALRAKEWGELQKTLIFETAKAGMNQFEQQIADLTAKAQAMRDKFGDQPEIDAWQGAQTDQVQGAEQEAALKQADAIAQAADRVRAQIEQLSLSLADEETRAFDAAVRRSEMVISARDNELIGAQTKADLLLQIQENYERKLTDIKTRAESQRLTAAKNVSSALMNLTNALYVFGNKKSRKMFELNKMAGIANATISTYAAAAAAMRDTPGPFWVRLAAAAAITAGGLSQVANISSQSFEGGSVAGGYGGGTPTSPTVTQPAAEIAPAQTTQTATQINIHIPSGVRIIDKTALDEFARELIEPLNRASIAGVR